jgi:simple sugar transport system permease protein
MSDATATTSKSKLPFKIKVEPRLKDPPRWYYPLLSLAAVAIALLVGALVIWLGGGNPWKAYSHIAQYSFGSVGVLSDTFVKAIPLMLVGLACSVAFRMKLWNIGAEGQFFLGAYGASMIVLLPVLPEDAPQWLFIPLM